MSRGPNKFKQREVTRAVKAVQAAGVENFTVVIDRLGNLNVVCNPAVKEPQGGGGQTAWAEAR